jgi:hypothetical protein
MGWVRTRLRLGGWLALVALALQLALSFGHVHAQDLGPDAAGTFAAEPASPDGDGDRHRPGRDGCAICATIHLAGTLALPAPPFIAPPPRPAVARAITAARHVPTVASAASFEARAPPQA